jgi:GxxExxY protein
MNSVTCPIKFPALSREEFLKLDYQIMRHAFACHNNLGRLCDEKIYQADMKERLERIGLGPIATEVPVTIRWKEFSKTYYLDLVGQKAAIYELKAAAAITGQHKTQLLNYLLILGLSVGKLLNFGAPSLQWHFASTRLTPEKRREIETDARGWQELSERCGRFRLAVEDLLTTWGEFLDLALYEEALIWLLGGDQMVIQSMPLSRESVRLGRPKVQLARLGYRLSSDRAHHRTRSRESPSTSVP